MPFRLGPGPVFGVEMTAAARRWQGYALRSCVVLLLLTALGLVVLNYHDDWMIRWNKPVMSLGDYARIGNSFVNAVLGTQLALVLLVAPAATAGAICIDKARGNLTMLMTTDMSIAEIVLGKLLARLLPVLILIAASIPVLFIIMLMGGVNLDQLFLGFMVLIGCAVFCCALALWMSVYVGKTQEALLLAYFVILIWLAAYPIVGYLAFMPPWFSVPRMALLNPFVMLLEPSSPSFGATMADYQIFMAVTIGCALVFVALAIWRLRRVVLNQENRPRRRKRGRKHSSRAELLNRDPLSWYEKHRRRPSKAGRLIWTVYFVLCCAGILYVLVQGLIFQSMDDSPSLICAGIVSVGLLLATVNAVTALADERTRGSLDILLLTPVRSRAVLWAKWKTAFGLVIKLAITPLIIGLLVWALTPTPTRPVWWNPRPRVSDPFQIPIVTLVALVFSIGAAGALLTSVGLMLATWVKSVARAVGLAIGVFVVVTFLMPVLVRMIFPRQFDMQGLALLSPAYVVNELVKRVGQWDIYWHNDQVVEISFMMACVHVVFAVFAYAVAWIAFDRKMGRISRDKPVALKDRTIWMKPVFGRGLRDVVE